MNKSDLVAFIYIKYTKANSDILKNSEGALTGLRGRLAR